jgi:release factor glutamine methyltransferase
MELSIRDALSEASQILQAAGVPDARRDAASLLAHVIGKNRTFLFSHAEEKLDANTFEGYREIVERRAGGEPLQYITGYQDFYGRAFRVTPDVLIPRPETELLVESALALMGGLRFCDVGTGSGCIAVTLLCERLNAHGVAVDVSAAALVIAEENAVTFKVNERVEFLVSDCFGALPASSAQFDLIVSNPPYVAAEVIAGLQREVRDHEPMTALTPGTDGLSIIRRLITEAPQFLRKDGHLLLEIGFDQGNAVRDLVNGSEFDLVDIRPDLAGIPRIVILRRL